MWDVIKNAVTQVKETLGIEIPELPVDLGSFDAAGIGEAGTTAAETVTGSAAGVVEDLTATAGEAATAAEPR
jgi:uncharacterized protein with GYD domain